MITDEMVEAAQPQGPWLCFHCGESFTDRREACLHFGSTERETAACQIDGGVLAELRKANHELSRYREEDSDKDRQMHRQRNEHVIALKRAEEAGYAKGLHAAPEYSALLQRERDEAVARAEAVRPKMVEIGEVVEHFRDVGGYTNKLRWGTEDHLLPIGTKLYAEQPNGPTNKA